MKRKLFQIAIPNTVKEKLHHYYLEQFQEMQSARLKQEYEAVKSVELSPVYISNLKVIIDRTSLLNELPKNACVGEICILDENLPPEILIVTKPKELHLIDISTSAQLYDSGEGIWKKKLIGEIKLGQVAICPGSFLEELGKFPDHYFDWLYLDAIFSCEDVTSALELCKTKVKEQGFIAGSNYISGSWLQMKRYGVVEAVHEFCKKNCWEMIYITHESHRILSYALRKMDITLDPPDNTKNNKEPIAPR